MKDDLISITGGSPALSYVQRRGRNKTRSPDLLQEHIVYTQEWVRKFCEAPMFTDIVSTSSQKASVSVPSPSPIASHPFGAGRPGSEFDIPHNGHMMR